MISDLDLDQKWVWVHAMGTVSEQYNVATDLESYSKLVSESVSSNIIKPVELHKMLIF